MVWNGLVSAQENRTNSGTKPLYQEGEKRFDRAYLDDFGLTLETYTYPEILDLEVKEYAGLSYRTSHGDRDRIHLVYNVTFTPDDFKHSSLTGDAEAETFTWVVDARPIELDGYAPSSHLIIEISNEIPSILVDYIIETLYGTDESDPRLPTPKELIEIFKEAQFGSTLLIIDHNNGLWTAIGPDEVVKMVGPTQFIIDAPTAIMRGPDWYTVSSY